MMRFTLLLLFAIQLFAGTAAAVELVDLQGKQHDLTAWSIGTNWKFKGTKSGEEVAFDGLDLASVKFSDQSVPTIPLGDQILLDSGEVIVCTPVSADIEHLTVQSPHFGGAKVPLSTVRGAVLDTDVSQSRVKELHSLFRESKPGGDTVLLKNKDVLQGTLLGLTATDVEFDRDGNTLTLSRDVVEAIIFDPSLLDYSIGNKFYGQLRLNDGSLLNVHDAVSAEENVRFYTLCGPSLTIATNALVDLSFRNGRMVYLSDLKPSTRDVQPFLDTAMAPQMDRSVLGTALQLAGRTYTKGIGVKSLTRLQFDLNGSYSSFQTTIGMDDVTGPQGSARFTVLVDGKQVFASDEMTASSEPVEVQVPVTDAETLELRVDFGRRGDVQDYANWCNARLLR